ncbi:MULTISPECIES: cytochrome P450 [Fischerella]|uniref:Cytochrome P450 n=1 Tax=Fischerella muscicola CCMEE 5323 TaxID=2019572 RepID=A0A2N6K2N4_FISMU|nr:cytochrome P450 [Fischerella muscicola]MBD2432330.1 cytochrome P450 [Fischerella sp. FACHB-380]PLZ89418.1 cytochrome P450 [Fischerella muscicola CCMEE 5323]
MTLLLAGHETTAIAMTWIWFLLSQHPQVEAKLQQELKTVLGDRSPTFADLRQLPYTQRVVLEGMRLYPPVYGMSRVAFFPSLTLRPKYGMKMQLHRQRNLAECENSKG